MGSNKELIDKRKPAMSKEQAKQITTTKKIIRLLDGYSVDHAKMIISALQIHLDSSSIVSIKSYELNVEPLFKSFHILRN